MTKAEMWDKWLKARYRGPSQKIDKKEFMEDMDKFLEDNWKEPDAQEHYDSLQQKQSAHLGG